MKEKIVFLGYPFGLPEVRSAAEIAVRGFAILKCADSDLTDLHLLDKIKGQMLDADLCLFDLTTHNVNVAVEYGFARGLRLAPLILYCDAERFRSQREHDIFSDLRGIDSLRYETFDELSHRLRARLPDLLSTTKKPPIDAPRLQMALQGRKYPNGGLFFEGEIFNAGKSAANRVKAALAGQMIYPGKIDRDPVRLGSLVPGQAAQPLRFRYDDLSYVRNPDGFEHVLVEYCDEGDQRYEQRGRFLAHRESDGTFSYSFEGLGPAKPIEIFSLKLQGLEMP